MLIPQGDIVYERLSTTFTKIDGLLDDLKTRAITGYCRMMFSGYDGAIIFDAEGIRQGIEWPGGDTAARRTGEPAIANFLHEAGQPDREMCVARLPQAIVDMLAADLDAVTVQAELSSDLTDLDALIRLYAKQSFTGYIDVILGSDAGRATLFLAQGQLLESIFTDIPTGVCAPHMSVDALMTLCRIHEAAFSVYQARTEQAGESHDFTGTVPVGVITLYEQILNALEEAVDPITKEGAFAKALKAALPPLAQRYEFLDPFLGEFRYAQKALTYTGNASYNEFVAGMCALINACLQTLYGLTAKDVVLPRISRQIEPVAMEHEELIDLLQLKICLPDIFQDYALLEVVSREEAGRGKRTDTQTALNAHGADRPDGTPREILTRWHASIARLQERYSASDGLTFRYADLNASQDFQDYKAATAQLRHVDPTMLRTRAEQLAFWLNAYNFLAIDNILEFNVPASVRDVKGFFTTPGYLIGGALFTLDDIEHGILRNNARHPATVFRQFRGVDPRKALCVSPLEGRIHCCLACGAASGAPLAVYLPDGLEEQLREAARRFLALSGMRLDLDSRELWLHRALYWYRKDLEQDGATLPDFVIGAMQDAQIAQAVQERRADLKLRFMDYDWSVNAA